LVAVSASAPARRHLALALIAAVLPVALIALAGCGSSGGTTESSSSSETRPPAASQSTSKAPIGATAKSCPSAIAPRTPIRVVGTSCGDGQATVRAWSGSRSCTGPSTASRSSCSVGGYRCLSVRTERAIEVNCARPGRSVSFRIEGAAPDAAGQ
jgi:hypothetical protein